MPSDNYLGTTMIALAATAALIGCSASMQEEIADALPPTRDSIAVVVFNETARTLRVFGRYGQGELFRLGEVRLQNHKGFIFPGHQDSFQLGVRRVGSASREPRWLSSLVVVPGDSIEYRLSVGGADRAQVTIRKAGRRTKMP